MANARGKVYRLYEMRDQMKDTLDQIEKVISDETKFIDFIKEHRKEGEYENEVKNLTEQVQENQKSYDDLKVRYEKINGVVEKLEANQNTVGIIKDAMEETIANILDAIIQ